MAAAKENKEDKTKELIDKLEKGIKETLNSEHYREFLKFHSQFHTYSINNSLLIFLQKPDASMVAGYKAWEKFERHVMKGEKGISILAPNPYKFKKEMDVLDPKTQKPVIDSATGKTKTALVEVQGMKFRKVSVFDVKQTDGKELPSICKELQGNSIESEKIIKAIKQISDYPIKEEVITSGAKGYFNRLEGVIAYNKGMSMDQTAKTLVHETAHSKIHNTEAASLMDRATKEVQAESIAFIVSHHFGLDTKQYSFDYLANWSSGKELKELKESLNIIQKTANNIIEKMETVLSKELQLQRSVGVQENIENNNEPKPWPKVTNITNTVIEQYKEQFPAITHIADKTASTIQNLNETNGKTLSINEIKQMYKDAGTKLESSFNKTDMYEFKLLKDVFDDFKQAQLTEKQIKAQEKVSQNPQQHEKNISIEMVD